MQGKSENEAGPVATGSGPSGGAPSRLSALAARARSIMAPALGLGALEIAIQIVGFAGMAAKFRYFGAATMGLIGYFGALGEIPFAFYSHFNRALVRFVPAVGASRKVEIFLTSLLVQLAVLSLFGLGLLAVLLFYPQAAFWNAHLEVDGAQVGFVAAFTAALIPVSLLQSLLGAMVQGFQQYRTVQAVKLFNPSAQLAGQLVLIWGGVEKLVGLRVYYCLVIGSASLSVAYLGISAWRLAGMGSHLGLLRPAVLSASVKSVYREYFRHYTLPMQFTALLAYVKENLAVLFLGQMGMMADAGVYNLANRIFNVPRRFIPGMVNLMMPKLVVAAAADTEKFRRKYDDFAWLQFFIHMGMALALFAGVPLVRIFFDAGNEPALATVFFFFASNLVINAQAHNNLHIIELGKDMRFYMVSAFIRVVFIVAITAALVPSLGNTGATIALLASTVVICLLQAWDTRRTGLWTWSQNYWQFLLWIGFTALCGLFFLAFPGTYPWHW